MFFFVSGIVWCSITAMVKMLSLAREKRRSLDHALVNIPVCCMREHAAIGTDLMSISHNSPKMA